MTRLGPALLALTLALAPRAAPAADATVEEAWGALGAAPWGATYEEWTRPGPPAACERFRSTGSSTTADEEWAYRCRREAAGTVREWYFYVFPGEPPAPRLEQLRVTVSPRDGRPSAPLAERHRVLAERISARHGAGERPAKLTVLEFGAASWRDVRRWRTDTLEILLYVDEPPSGSPYVGVLARHRPLLAALREDERERAATGAPAWAEQVEARLAVLLGDELRATHPDYGALLARFRESPMDPAAQAKAYAMALDLLKAAGARDARRPALLLAADQLARQLGSGDERSPEGDARRRALGAHGLTWQWAPLGATWVYGHDLLWQVWRESPGSPWGERAFVRLLDLGWDTSVGCGQGSDRFRDVIREGEAFLTGRPGNPARVDVEFMLAQAYETWWSLSQASPEDQYAEPARYQPGAPTARQKAIALYGDVLRVTPDRPEAAYARRTLPRLALGFATNQRRFFCVYD